MSTLRCNVIQNTSGVEQYLCKAWVNFNGTGTVAIRASGNVSSITDNGTGDYTVNFASAFSDANYNLVASRGYTFFVGADQPIAYEYFISRSASSARVLTVQGNSAGLDDPTSVNVSVFR